MEITIEEIGGEQQDGLVCRISYLLSRRNADALNACLRERRKKGERG